MLSFDVTFEQLGNTLGKTDSCLNFSIVNGKASHHRMCEVCGCFFFFLRMQHIFCALSSISVESSCFIRSILSSVFDLSVRSCANERMMITLLISSSLKLLNNSLTLCSKTSSDVNILINAL